MLEMPIELRKSRRWYASINVQSFAVHLLLGAATIMGASPASAQVVPDTLVAWKGYARSSHATISVYKSIDTKRPYAVLINEIASNEGMTITEDSRYLVEQIGRQFGLDPANAIWFFRWRASSFTEGAESDKSLILRATFNRSKSGGLGSASWRIASVQDVEEMTDRQARLR